MDARLVGIAERQGGPFTRAQALSCGVPDDELYRLVRRKQLRRLRRGAYVSSRLFDPLDDVARHVVMIRAVLLSLEERVVVSHASAAALHGLALWGIDLRRVHVTRLDQGVGRGEAGVEHHVGFIDDADVHVVDGIRAVAPDRAAVETALTADFASGVAVVDSVMHAGSATPEALRALLDKMRAWPGSVAAARAVSFADGRSESVGESRARVLFAQLGLPEPVLQPEIRDPFGRFVGRVDFLFAAERTIVEFDGRVKLPSASLTFPWRTGRGKFRLTA
jgi:hypothetical protein